MFKSCSSLTSVTIGNGIASIGLGAFSGCSSLKYNEYDNAYYLGNADNPYLVLVKVKSKDITSCKINEKTKVIADVAFEGCSSLTSITIPNSLKSIGYEAFEDCSSLARVDITDMKAWCNIDFDSSTSNPLVYAQNLYLNGELVTALEIPFGVTSIGDYAFRNCSNLTSITIPNSVTSIGDYAFSNCSSLTSITVPNSVTSIGDYAFSNCSSLTSITVPNSVARIGYRVFNNCSSLASITIPNSVTSIGSYAFAGCSSLKTIYCEAESQPSGWYSFWIFGCSAKVVWGYKG